MEDNMNSEAQVEELLSFFKALADANRLKIIGLLAQQPSTVEQLSAMLGLAPSTVSRHLSYLVHVGLASARAEGYYNVYRFEAAALEQMARRLLARETLPAIASDVDMDAYDRKVLRDFSLPDGTLRSLPMQRKKLDVILRHAVELFEPGVRYSEKQVNETLKQIHEDTATLRREMVAARLMARDHGEYWRVGAE
jgi:predicted transcriptional regulator